MSTFDLTSGFLQVLLSNESIKYVSFCLFGRVYCLKMLPFRTAVSTSQFIRCLYQVLDDEVLVWAIADIDDLAVSSPGVIMHIDRLEQFFEKIKQGGLTLKLEKSKFLARELKYFGYRINGKSVSACSDKIKLI